MKTSSFAALLCAASLFLPSARGQQADAARKQFMEAKARAEKGDAEAEHALGDFYISGAGVKRNEVEAVKWWRKAAEHGHSGAQEMLGDLHFGRGQWGVKKDEVEAVKWWRTAAEQNLPSAQYKLAGAIEQGRGVAQDDVEAYAWYELAATRFKAAVSSRDALEKKLSPQQIADGKKRAGELRVHIQGQKSLAKTGREAHLKAKAEGGDAQAQFELGRLLLGEKADDAEQSKVAIQWLLKAALQDHAEAQQELAVCYGFGKGVSRDDVESYAWNKLALEKPPSATSSARSFSISLFPQRVPAGNKRVDELRAQIESRRKSYGK